MIAIASKLTEQKMKKSLIEYFIFCAVTVCKYYVKPWVNSSGLYFSTAFAFKKQDQNLIDGIILISFENN